MKTRTIYRNAITGEIVTAKFAKENPDTTVKETMKRVPLKAVRMLKKYNRWRRGAEIKQPDPKEIGQAIDDIINYFSK